MINFADDLVPNVLLVSNVSSVTLTYGKKEIENSFLHTPWTQKKIKIITAREMSIRNEGVNIIRSN